MQLSAIGPTAAGAWRITAQRPAVAYVDVTQARPARQYVLNSHSASTPRPIIRLKSGEASPVVLRSTHITTMPGAHHCFPCRGLRTFLTREELIVHSDRASHPYCKACQKYVRTAADFEWHLVKVHGSRARNMKNYCVVCDMEIARTRNFCEHQGRGNINSIFDGCVLV